MEGGGRSACARAAAASAAKKKKEKNNDTNTSQEQTRHPVPFAQILGVTDVLRELLVALGTTKPSSFMIEKSLVTSNMNHDQACLLLSCKRESLPQVTDVFTETETRFVEDKAGLLFTAFDHEGRSYNLTCKHLESNHDYRFITGWNAYVVDNDLGVAMRVELWWFRSLKLHNRYELCEHEGGKAKVPVMVDSGHPDGSLGLVLLHYDNNLLLEPEQAAAEEPNEAPPVQETENDDLEPEQADDDEPDESPSVQETETGHMESKTTTTTAEDKLGDDSGTCAESIKSKTTVAEDKLADGGGECDEPRIEERNIVISRDDVINAAIGLLELRRHYGGGGGGGGGGGEPGS